MSEESYDYKFNFEIPADAVVKQAADLVMKELRTEVFEAKQDVKRGLEACRESLGREIADLQTRIQELERANNS